MKTIGLIVALCITPVLTHAATRLDRTLTVNPVDLFTGTFNLEYEQALNSSISAYGGLNFLYLRGVLRSDAAQSVAAGPEVGLRLYLLGNAPAGLWMGPYLGASFVNNTVNGNNYGSLGYGLGAMAGFNLVLSRLNLSFGLGTGWVDYSALVDGARVGLYGVVPRARFAVGVVF